tara:strand:- start:1992 stop:2669 length:678 start_codon:yes stop_codon:yes gene_type:complete
MINLIKKILPRKLINLVGFYLIFFSKKIHHKTYNGFYKDKFGDYLPWFTYPCIEFLKTLNLTDKKVLEFGSGSSTLFWSKKCLFVYSIEKDKSWFDKLNKKTIKNVKLFLFEDDENYSCFPLQLREKFDVLVIDGAARKNTLFNSIKLLNDDGIIIFDNIEWYPNCAKYLRKQDYIQIDFSGFSPLNSFESCTSIFFKKTKNFEKRLIPENWHPIGGRFLKAYDD